MKFSQFTKKYSASHSRNLSVLGKNFEADWNAILTFFVGALVVLCILAGVCYYWMITSIFPEVLTKQSTVPSSFTSDKELIDQAQSFMQAKAQQFEAAR